MKCRIEVVSTPTYRMVLELSEVEAQVLKNFTGGLLPTVAATTLRQHVDDHDALLLDRMLENIWQQLIDKHV